MGPLIPQLLRDHVERQDKRIVVLDQSGELYEAWKGGCGSAMNTATRDPETGKQTAPVTRSKSRSHGAVTDEVRFELSDRVRKGSFTHSSRFRLMCWSTHRTGPTDHSFYAENTALSE